MFSHIKQHLLIITLSAALAGCSSTQKASGNVLKNGSDNPSDFSSLKWYKKPGTIKIDDFENIAMIYSGSGYNTYPEQTGYSPTWLEVNAKDLVGATHYTGNAIIGITNGQKQIFDFNGSVINSFSFHSIVRDDILGAYVYDEDSGSSDVHYFDKDFQMHTATVNGIGGDISNDYAVYSNGKVYYNGSSVSSAEDYAGNIPVIIPVINSFSARMENELSLNETSLTPDGYVILRKGNDPVMIPDGMVPSYVESIQGKDIQDQKDRSYNTSFVNDVIKLIDKNNQIRLWKYSTQSYITSESFEDATFYEDGCIGVQKNSKWAFMDSDGLLLTDYIFDKVSEVYKGHAYVILNHKTGILMIPQP